jgi:hypothetical protein
MCKKEWIKTGFGNEILNFDNFTLSYNPDVATGLAGLLDAIMGYNQHEETAILVDDNCYILNGDHREQLLVLSLSGLPAVLAYFKSKHQEWGPTSDKIYDTH